MSALEKEAKKLIEKIPSNRLLIARVFLQWLAEDESLNEKEVKQVIEGEKEIKAGNFIKWREVARSI